MKRRLLSYAAHVLVFLVLAAPDVALAYGGPGSIVSGVGAVIAAIAAVGAAIFGFLWFPLKRVYQKFRSDGSDAEVAEEG